jgi:hypothetical protein
MPFTEDNPFVSDPLYFYNRTHYIYSETLVNIVQVTYNWICFSLGLPLFFLICYLLAAQTPNTLKPYRKMLLLITVVDLFVLINCVGAQFVSS